MFVRKFPRHILITLLVAALMLAACNVGAAPSPTLDVNAINTAIVGTTVAQLAAQFTQTALAAPTTPAPTNTPQELPTFAQPTTDAGAPPTVSFDVTPTLEGVASPLPAFTQVPTKAPAAALGDSCNNSAFEGDITIPDGTVIKPGADFKKTWKLRNTGTCTWDEGYTLVYVAGSTQNLDPYNFEFQSSSDFVKGGGAIDMTLTLSAPCKPGKYEGHWRMRTDGGYYFGTLLSVYIEVQEKCK
jgi:hypothetical protein